MTVKYHNDIEQGTPEWHELRGEYLTGTDAIHLLKGKDIEDILSDKINKTEFNGNSATRRGHRLEPEAIAILEAIKDINVHHAGFITNTKYPLAGYSPDGLIDKDGLVECKAFSKDRHEANNERIEIQIIAQVQWGLFVSERKWAYIVFYNPDLPPEQAIHIKYVERNPATMKRFEALIGE